MASKACASGGRPLRPRDRIHGPSPYSTRKSLAFSTPPHPPPRPRSRRFGRNNIPDLHHPVVQLAHLVLDPRGPVLQGKFAERVERAESPAADLQVAAHFILVR